MKHISERDTYSFLRLFLLGCIVLCSFCAANAQTRSITGTVVDENGEPLIGVTVAVKKRSTMGTLTDLDGNFKLDVPENTTLHISYIGYDSREIVVGSQNTFHIVLKEHVYMDSHFRTNPYRRNEQHRQQTAGLLQTAGIPLSLYGIESNPMHSLEGTISGTRSLPVSENSSQIYRTFIRGVHSFTSTDPLYIIDGVPMPGDPSGTLLSHLNNLDIASIYVKRDVSETAFYGAQGANGVVMIYTHDPDFVRYTPIYRFSARGGYAQAPTGEGGSTKDVFSMQYTASVLSGYPRSENRWTPQIYASLDYLNTPSVIKGEGLERYSMRFNMDQQPTDLVTFGISSSASRLEVNDHKETHIFLAPYMRLNFNPQLHFTSRGGVDYMHATPELSSLYQVDNRTTVSLSNLINYYKHGWSNSNWIYFYRFNVTGGQEIQHLYKHTLNSFPVQVSYEAKNIRISGNYRLESYFSNNQIHWGSFGSIGMSYNLKEQFLKSFEGLDWLVLRASYGSVGNIAPWLGDSWERTNRFNAGLSTVWGRNIIHFTVDYYKDVTSDLLLPPSGQGAQYFLWNYVNDTQLRTQGIDMTLSTILDKRGYKWKTDIKATHSKGSFKRYEMADIQLLLLAAPWLRYYRNPDWYGSVVSTLKMRRWELRVQGNYSFGGVPLVGREVDSWGNEEKAGNSFSIYSARMVYNFGRYTDSRSVFVEGNNLHTFGEKQVYYKEKIFPERSIVVGMNWKIY